MAAENQKMDYSLEMSRLQDMMNGMRCSPPVRPGQSSLEDYTVQQPLGKGAYGNVYSVRNKKDGKDYALKTIVLSAKEGLPQSVLREMTVMKQLSRKNNPNIVSLKEVFHVVSNRNILRINMIMEKCDWDLYTFLRQLPRAVPEHQARHITAQMVKGIDFLHSHSIIHRDLKPQNILVNRDQSVKIADFGLSKEQSNTTAFTTLVVTLWYRAPEVLLQSYYSSTVDMWSLGCIVSEIYSRQPLFSGQTEAEQLTDIFKKVGTPVGKQWPQESVIKQKSFKVFPKKNLKDLNEHMSSGALDFVEQCLRFEPNKRISARVALDHYFLKNPTVRRVLKPLNKQSNV